MAGLTSDNISLASARQYGFSKDRNTCVFCAKKTTAPPGDPTAPIFAFFSLVDCRHYVCQPCALVNCDNAGRYVRCPTCNAVSRLAQSGKTRTGHRDARVSIDDGVSSVASHTTRRSMLPLTHRPQKSAFAKGDRSKKRAASVQFHPDPTNARPAAAASVAVRGESAESTDGETSPLTRDAVGQIPADPLYVKRDAAHEKESSAGDESVSVNLFNIRPRGSASRNRAERERERVLVRKREKEREKDRDKERERSRSLPLPPKEHRYLPPPAPFTRPPPLQLHTVEEEEEEEEERKKENEERAAILADIAQSLAATLSKEEEEREMIAAAELHRRKGIMRQWEVQEREELASRSQLEREFDIKLSPATPRMEDMLEEQVSATSDDDSPQQSIHSRRTRSRTFSSRQDRAPASSSVDAQMATTAEQNANERANTLTAGTDPSVLPAATLAESEADVRQKSIASEGTKLPNIESTLAQERADESAAAKACESEDRSDGLAKELQAYVISAIKDLLASEEQCRKFLENQQSADVKRIADDLRTIMFAAANAAAHRAEELRVVEETSAKASITSEEVKARWVIVQAERDAMALVEDAVCADLAEFRRRAMALLHAQHRIHDEEYATRQTLMNDERDDFSAFFLHWRTSLEIAFQHFTTLAPTEEMSSSLAPAIPLNTFSSSNTPTAVLPSAQQSLKEELQEKERRMRMEQQQESEKEMLDKMEREWQLEKERIQEMKQAREEEFEKERKEDLEMVMLQEQEWELEKERLRESRRARQQEIEKEWEEEMEKERQQEQEWELKKERQKDVRRARQQELEKEWEEEQKRYRQQEQEWELQRERQRELRRLEQQEIMMKRQAQLKKETEEEQERERQFDRERELERERQRESSRARQRELEKEKQEESGKEKQEELEREWQLEKEMLDKMERDWELEKERRQEIKKAKQQELEKERKEEMEKERQQELEWELEKEKQRELRRSKQQEVMMKRQAELKKEAEEDRKRERQLDMEWELQKERLREIRRAKQQELEKERKEEMEKERQQEQEWELERERRRELRRSKQQEVMMKRQAELKKEAEEDKERERQLDMEWELQKERQQEIRRARQQEREKERQHSREIQLMEDERRNELYRIDGFVEALDAQAVRNAERQILQREEEIRIDIGYEQLVERRSIVQLEANARTQLDKMEQMLRDIEERSHHILERVTMEARAALEEEEKQERIAVDAGERRRRARLTEKFLEYEEECHSAVFAAAPPPLPSPPSVPVSTSVPMPETPPNFIAGFMPTTQRSRDSDMLLNVVHSTMQAFSADSLLMASTEHMGRLSLIQEEQMARSAFDAQYQMNKLSVIHAFNSHRSLLMMEEHRERNALLDAESNARASRLAAEERSRFLFIVTKRFDECVSEERHYREDIAADEFRHRIEIAARAQDEWLTRTSRAVDSAARHVVADTIPRDTSNTPFERHVDNRASLKSEPLRVAAESSSVTDLIYTQARLRDAEARAADERERRVRSEADARAARAESTRAVRDAEVLAAEKITAARAAAEREAQFAADERDAQSAAQQRAAELSAEMLRTAVREAVEEIVRASLETRAAVENSKRQDTFVERRDTRHRAEREKAARSYGNAENANATWSIPAPPPHQQYVLRDEDTPKRDVDETFNSEEIASEVEEETVVMGPLPSDPFCPRCVRSNTAPCTRCALQVCVYCGTLPPHRSCCSAHHAQLVRIFQRWEQQKLQQQEQAEREAQQKAWLEQEKEEEKVQRGRMDRAVQSSVMKRAWCVDAHTSPINVARELLPEIVDREESVSDVRSTQNVQKKQSKNDKSLEKRAVDKEKEETPLQFPKAHEPRQLSSAASRASNRGDASTKDAGEEPKVLSSTSSPVGISEPKTERKHCEAFFVSLNDDAEPRRPKPPAPTNYIPGVALRASRDTKAPSQRQRCHSSRPQRPRARKISPSCRPQMHQPSPRQPSLPSRQRQRNPKQLPRKARERRPEQEAAERPQRVSRERFGLGGAREPVGPAHALRSRDNSYERELDFRDRRDATGRARAVHDPLAPRISTTTAPPHRSSLHSSIDIDKNDDDPPFYQFTNDSFGKGNAEGHADNYSNPHSIEREHALMRTYYAGQPVEPAPVSPRDTFTRQTSRLADHGHVNVSLERTPPAPVRLPSARGMYDPLSDVHEVRQARRNDRRSAPTLHELDQRLRNLQQRRVFDRLQSPAATDPHCQRCQSHFDREGELKQRTRVSSRGRRVCEACITVELHPRTRSQRSRTRQRSALRVVSPPWRTDYNSAPLRPPWNVGQPHGFISKQAHKRRFSNYYQEEARWGRIDP